MARTIQSPGVEIKEIDQSLRPVLPAGTNVLVAGFTDQGPSDEVIQVTSQSEFEQIYGIPKTPAERYFYHSVRPLFQSPANIQTYRLPYGDDKGRGFGNKYSALVYTASAYDMSNIGTRQFGTTMETYNEQETDVTYVLNAPQHIELTETQYNDILQRKTFNWSASAARGSDAFSGDDLTTLGRSALIVLNKAQTTINNKFEGFYLGGIDNTNLNPATNFDGIQNAFTVAVSGDKKLVSDYTKLPATRLQFALSSVSDNSTDTFGVDDGSVSEVMENLTQFDISSEDFNDTLSFGLFKLRQSPFSPDSIKLDYVLSESFVGSTDYHRQIQSKDGGVPKSFYLDTVEDGSPNVTVLTNDFISNRNSDSYADINGNPTKIVRFASGVKKAQGDFDNNTATFGVSSEYVPSYFAAATGVTDAQMTNLRNNLNAQATNFPADSLFPVGVYSDNKSDSKRLGSIPGKLDRLFDSVENVDLFDIDLTVDGGISTIHAMKELNNDEFDDLISVDSTMQGFYTSDIINGLSDSAKTFRSNWKTIFDRFSDFAEKRRKDHMFISDLPRPLFLQGKSNLTLNDASKNFSLNVLKPIQAHTSVVNTSYATTYGQWVQIYDSYLDDQFYAPFSGFAAASMANTDANFQPWFAPAGFTRGIVTGVNDLALYPKQKQRDQLYKISVNPVAFFPNEGFVMFGQKTLLKKPSAFDRINVRRLFLNLEKAVRQTVKFFVFEPNTLLTRTRVINTINPIFANAKNTEGVYDYLLVCDERNNTPEVIDQNELVVDIYLKPVRAAEFILVNFYATRTGTDFNELVG
jgi:hypothetical protein